MLSYQNSPIKNGKQAVDAEEQKRVMAEINKLEMIPNPDLSDDQIQAACRASAQAGASFVKTGTGWADCSNIAHAVSLMYDAVGDHLGIKAAGGIRDLETLTDLYHRGARRFGVGVDSAIKILQQCEDASKS